MDYDVVQRKFDKARALFLRATTPGEKEAARVVCENLREKLSALEKEGKAFKRKTNQTNQRRNDEPKIRQEKTFSDSWKAKLLRSILKIYSISGTYKKHPRENIWTLTYECSTKEDNEIQRFYNDTLISIEDEIEKTIKSSIKYKIRRIKEYVNL